MRQISLELGDRRKHGTAVAVGGSALTLGARTIPYQFLVQAAAVTSADDGDKPESIE